MNIEYVVIENTTSMGSTQKEEIAKYSCVKDAIKIAKPLKESEYKWYTIEVKF